jgi:hypothetical protein
MGPGVPEHANISNGQLMVARSRGDYDDGLERTLARLEMHGAPEKVVDNERAVGNIKKGLRRKRNHEAAVGAAGVAEGRAVQRAEQKARGKGAAAAAAAAAATKVVVQPIVQPAAAAASPAPSSNDASFATARGGSPAQSPAPADSLDASPASSGSSTPRKAELKELLGTVKGVKEREVPTAILEKVNAALLAKGFNPLHHNAKLVATVRKHIEEELHDAKAAYSLLKGPGGGGSTTKARAATSVRKRPSPKGGQL